MRCSQAQILINDHIDHLLDNKKIEKLEGHLQKCSRCRNLLAEMVSMVGEVKQLEVIPISEDLWPSIKRQIIEKDRKEVIRLQGKRPFFGFSRYPVRLAYAVSTLLAVIFLVSLFYYRLPFIRNERNELSKNELENFKLAEQEFQTSIAALDKAISDLNVKLNPELATVFKQNLEIIDNSIRACQSAMSGHRENRVANLHLLICYRKKLELLNEMKNITMQSG